MEKHFLNFSFGQLSVWLTRCIRNESVPATRTMQMLCFSTLKTILWEPFSYDCARITVNDAAAYTHSLPLYLYTGVNIKGFMTILVMFFVSNDKHDCVFATLIRTHARSGNVCSMFDVMPALEMH